MFRAIELVFLSIKTDHGTADFVNKPEAAFNLLSRKCAKAGEQTQHG